MFCRISSNGLLEYHSNRFSDDSEEHAEFEVLAVSHVNLFDDQQEDYDLKDDANSKGTKDDRSKLFLHCVWIYLK